MSSASYDACPVSSPYNLRMAKGPLDKARGGRIRAIRAELGVSQGELARLVSATLGLKRPLSRTSISYWEEGRGLGRDKVRALAGLSTSGKTTGWILDGPESAPEGPVRDIVIKAVRRTISLQWPSASEGEIHDLVNRVLEDVVSGASEPPNGTRPGAQKPKK